MNHNRLEHGPSFVLVALTTIVCTGVADAQVEPIFDGLPPVMAYSGTLELNGRPFDGFAEFHFTITTTVGVGGELLWEEEWSDANAEAGCGSVEVFQGAFAVELGRCEAIGLGVISADGPYLGVSVREVEAGVDWIPLDNPQRLTAAPFAVRATFADSLTVRGAIQAGSIQSNGDVEGRDVTATRSLESLGSLAVAGNAEFSQDIIVDENGRLQIRNSVDLAAHDSPTALQIGTTNSTHMLVDTNGLSVYTGRDPETLLLQASGGDTRIAGPVDVRENLNVEGDTRIRDNLQVDGDLHVLGSIVVGGTRVARLEVFPEVELPDLQGNPAPLQSGGRVFGVGDSYCSVSTVISHPQVPSRCQIFPANDGAWWGMWLGSPCIASCIVWGE